MTSAKTWISRLFVFSVANTIVVQVVLGVNLIQAVQDFSYFLAFNTGFWLLFLGLGQAISRFVGTARISKRIERGISYLLVSLLYAISASSIIGIYSATEYSISFQTAIIALFLVLCVCTLSLLNDAMAEMLFHNTLIQVLVLGVAGGISAVGFSLIGTLVLVSLGLHVTINPGTLLLAAFFTGLFMVSASVLGRERRLGFITSQIARYCSTIIYYGKNNSLFLDSITPDKYSYAKYDSIETHERLEYLVPWLLLSLSLSILFISIVVQSVLLSTLEYDLITLILGILAIVSIVGFTLSFIQSSYEAYSNYKKWRVLWSGFWGIIRVFSMSKEAAAVEYSFRYVDSYLTDIDYESEDIDQVIDEIASKHSLSLPALGSQDEKRVTMTNLILYDTCKNALSMQGSEYTELENVFHFSEKSRNILNGVTDLTSAVSRQDLGIAVLFATILEECDLPIEMLIDLDQLLTSNWVANPEMFSLGTDQLAILEESPQRIIPDSIKWLPAIIPIALWIANTLLA